MKHRATIIWPCCTRAGHRGSERTMAGVRAPRWLDTRLTRYSNSYRRTYVALRRRRRQNTPLETSWWSIRQKPGNMSVSQLDRGSTFPTRQWKIHCATECRFYSYLKNEAAICYLAIRTVSSLSPPSPLLPPPFLLKETRIMSMYNLD